MATGILSTQLISEIFEQIDKYEWDDTITYNRKDICHYESHLYMSVCDNNINNIPDKSVYWKQVV